MISGPALTLVVVVRVVTILILEVFIIIITSWIPPLVVEASLVGLDVSSRENSERGFVEVYRG